ncbi:heme NO-binding domain-containing protein [Pendulispora albinea]|uniref:Heme NO-binding domain-containing protein n=1 Tax=Pendulispora albinea TaxID=2741071 RepID=A0ABZ2M122_9BACT
MHGIILLELKKYVESRWGKTAWPTLVADTGLAGQTYLPVHEYPDDEMVALVRTASTTTGFSVPAILEDFGEFIVPDLLLLYRSLIHSKWRTLDLLENTEKMIQRVVSLRNPSARTLQMSAERRTPTEVRIRHRSAHRVCSVTKGIARGAAKHYGERIAIVEAQCITAGASECVLDLRLMN